MAASPSAEHASTVKSPPASAVLLELRDGGHCSRRRTNASGTGALECDRLITADVPHNGWHEPSVVTPARDLYCLNATAGPGVERAGPCRENPGHTGVRDSWGGRAVNPRLPLCTTLDSRRDRT